jgi:plasmid stabilization system protein ParE
MRRVIVTNRADAEFMRAVHHYNKKVPGLGDRFRVTLLNTFDGIAERPESFLRFTGEIRRAVVKVFPFVIHFLAEEEKIVVLSVLHSSRNPAELRKRGIEI